mmetsp:Transcript_9706/g.30753  ORF Transcript_9706/g.30753 Transcript_9706/m.30753 type:complete len:156 (+) Transcript_9706:131-598(+)
MNDDLPARVQQDDTTPANGNALQACVCSLLGKTLSETPNFVKAPEGYEKAIAAYLREHDGRRPVKVALPSDALDAHDGRLCILRGTSPRGDFGHVARRRRPTRRPRTPPHVAGRRALPRRGVRRRLGPAPRRRVPGPAARLGHVLRVTSRVKTAP